MLLLCLSFLSVDAQVTRGQLLRMFYKAGSYHNAGNDEQAIETYREIATLAPRYPDTYLRMAEIYDKAGDAQSAVVMYRKHKRVKREKRRLGDKTVVNNIVAICNPALAGRTGTTETVAVVMAFPDAVAPHEPIGRRPRSYRAVDENVLLRRAHFAAEIADGSQIGRVTVRRAVRIAAGAHAVELEKIHIVIFDHLQYAVAERGVVFRLRKLHSRRVAIDKAHALGVIESARETAAVPAEGTHPCSDRCSGHEMRFVCEFLKTVREVRVKAPERIEVIPPVVPEVGIDENAAFLPQLLAESAHRRKRLLARKALLDRQIVAVYTVIVPVVVMR